jgi:hypothetical protein
LVNTARTTAAVRFRLLVAVSTSSAGAVTLVHDLLVLLCLIAAAGLVDGALDDVGRHVGRAGLVERQPQTVVGVRVGPTGAHRDADLTGDLGEYRAALGIVGALLALDL